MEAEYRCLFGLGNGNVAENVVFPDPFYGKEGENVYLFKFKFERAIADTQLREVDKVEVFMKHLKG